MSTKVKTKRELWQLIDLVDQLHNCIVTLAHFVACDANGVPLEKPNDYEVHCLGMDKNPKQVFLKQQYNEAQKSVIFEGWQKVGDIIENEKGDMLYISSRPSFFRIKRRNRAILYQWYTQNTKSHPRRPSRSDNKNPSKTKIMTNTQYNRQQQQLTTLKQQRNEREMEIRHNSTG